MDKNTRIKYTKNNGSRVYTGSAGARSFIAPIDGLDKVDYLTSTEARRVTVQPKSIVIIGGGYIAAELGHFYGALGTEITIIQRGPLLINREDEEDGFVKFIIEPKQKKILGCHILGPDAATLIHEVIVAMKSRRW